MITRFVRSIMTRKGILLTGIACLVVAQADFADEPKYHDKDLVYDEAKVPAYDLPPLLMSSEGKPITTSEEWLNIRRPQILSLFGNLIYGTVPAPESPIQTTVAVVKTNREFMNGHACTRVSASQLWQYPRHGS